jgi:hypothetical protein
MPEKNNTIDHNLLVDFNSSLSTILEDAKHHQHREKSADIEKFKYTGDNSYVTSVLSKAHAQFPDEPDLAAVIALMGKEEQEDAIRNAKTAQWIQQTQQKIDQQQASLGQHSADLQDKEVRFRAQDQRFQDFNAQVAAMNLNPVQQAQAAQEFQKNPEQDPQEVLSKYKAPEQQVKKPASAPAINPAGNNIPANDIIPADKEVSNTVAPDRRKKTKDKETGQAATQNANIKAVKSVFGDMPLFAPHTDELVKNYQPVAKKRSSIKYTPTPSQITPQVRDVIAKAKKPRPQEVTPMQEGIIAGAIEDIASMNGKILMQAFVKGKSATLQFPGTGQPIPMEPWQVRGFIDIFKSMGNTPGKEATMINLLSNPTYLLQWMMENLPAPNQMKKVTRRVPKGQTADMFNTPPPKAPATPEPVPQQAELFETPNKIEDDLLLEYLVSLNTVLDNASK